MRIVTYNVEWFSNLFDAEDRLLDDGGWSGRRDVTRAQQIAALAKVFTALDADAVMVIEAPDQSRKHSTVKALEGFSKAFALRARRALIGFANDTQQEIALLYDPDRIAARHDPQGAETGKKGSGTAPRFDGVFRIDLDVDATEDLVRFSKPPLEVALTTPKGRHIRLIGAHLKSKAPHGARGRDAVMRQSIANRRKQLAQAIWLRQRVNDHLSASDDLIVLGDLNDGPGLDEYEHLFGRSSVEIVLGEIELGEEDALSLFDPHARHFLKREPGPHPTTARFELSRKKQVLQALLDYIMVSPGLKSQNPQWRIWHPIDDPETALPGGLSAALLTASDHFPVVLDIDI